MDYKKSLPSVFGIERGHCGRGYAQQPVVIRHRLKIGICPIGQQGEVNLTAWIGQIADFHLPDLLPDARIVGEQRRHDNKRTQRL